MQIIVCTIAQTTERETLWAEYMFRSLVRKSNLTAEEKAIAWEEVDRLDGILFGEV